MLITQQLTSGSFNFNAVSKKYIFWSLVILSKLSDLFNNVHKTAGIFIALNWNQHTPGFTCYYHVADITDQQAFMFDKNLCLMVDVSQKFTLAFELFLLFQPVLYNRCTKAVVYAILKG